jgi:hypothetical protein
MVELGRGMNVFGGRACEWKTLCRDAGKKVGGGG